MNGKMAFLSLIFGTAILVMVVTPALSARTFTHSWWRVGFETPTAFSKPIRLGLDAAALVSPPEKGLGQGRMEITLVAVPKDLQESLGHNETEILSYVKSTFLGTVKPAESKVERSFMGQTIQGEFLKTTLPKPGNLEIYLVTLSGGDQVAIGLTHDLETTAEEARQVMDLAAKTFKEIPGQ